MAKKLNEEQQELLDDIADSVEKTNTKVASLEQKVDSLIELLQNGNSGKKEDSDDILNVKKQLVKNAFSEYFNERDEFLSHVMMNLTDDNIKSLVDGIHGGIADRLIEYQNCKQKEIDESNKKNAELRKQQGIGSLEQVAEWAPEYPEAVRAILFFIATRIFTPSAKPEFVHEVSKILGDTLMVNYHEQFSWRGMVGYYRKKIERFLSNWKLVTLSICLNAAIIFIGTMAVYHSKVVDVDMRNQIIDYYWKKDYFRQKEVQMIDSILKQEGHYDAVKWVEDR